jgi:hypothetical protein
MAREITTMGGVAAERRVARINRTSSLVQMMERTLAAIAFDAEGASSLRLRAFD